ncbi:hypothetical protein ACTFIU_007699 [Dictyostelium citrinum]
MFSINRIFSFIFLIILFHSFVVSGEIESDKKVIDCCHKGNNILSSALCSQDGLNYISIGNNFWVPCPNGSVTLSWNHQYMVNSSFSWVQCKLKNNESIQYYQVGDCNGYGTQIGSVKKLKFDNGAPFFYILNCIRKNGNNSYSTIIAPSENWAEGYIKDDYLQQCKDTGGDSFQFNDWSYGNDLDCLSTNKTKCTCPPDYVVIHNTTQCQ